MAAMQRKLEAALVDNKKLKLEAKKVGKDRKDDDGDEDMDGEDEQDDDEHERIQKRLAELNNDIPDLEKMSTEGCKELAVRYKAERELLPTKVREAKPLDKQLQGRQKRVQEARKKAG